MRFRKSVALELNKEDRTATRRLNEQWFEEGWCYRDGFERADGTVVMILEREEPDQYGLDDDDDDDLDD